MNLPKPELDSDKAMELWLKEHSEYEKEQLVLSNIGLVGIVMRQCSLSIQDEDLFATGVVGLIKAVNTFDKSKGYAFTTYAVKIIRNEIYMTFRKKNVSIAFSLDDTYKLDNGESISYMDMTADDKTFEESIENKVILKQLFSKLSAREQQVFFMTYGENMTQKKISDLLGVSQAQVSRILRKVREKYKS